MQTKRKPSQFLYVVFMVGFLVLIGGCSSPPEISIIVPKEPAVELATGESIPLETEVIKGEAVQFLWTAKCSQVDDNECQQVLKNNEGETNFLIAPDRPGEQIVVSVVAVDSRGRESKKDTKTIAVISSQKGPITVFLKNGQVVPCENHIGGEYSSDITGPIWPVIYIGGRYHPQDEGGEAPLKIGGRWSAVVRFGDCDKQGIDEGKPFQLFMMEAGEQCSRKFEEYLKDWPSPPDNKAIWPGIGKDELPEDCVVHNQITVIRE